MADQADFIWDFLGDQWDPYVQHDQIATLWDGYIEIASDLVLQAFQANLSKSISDIPVFRRYRWLNYRLNRTKVPPSSLLPFKFCYELDNDDILQIPDLRDQVRETPEESYVQITNGASGTIITQSRLVDTSGKDFIALGVRAGDTVVFTSGTDLPEEDTGIRFRVDLVEAVDTLLLAADNLSNDATAIRYRIDRNPTLTLVEDVHYLVGDSTLCLDNVTLDKADGTGDAWRTVDQVSWTGSFIRDDPRVDLTLPPVLDRDTAPIGGAVRPRATNAASVVSGSKTLTDTSADFSGDGVRTGDYLILRPSGVSPTQILTDRLFFRIVNVGTTTLDVQGTFPLTANQLTYDIVMPSVDTFDLVCTEDGTDAHPRAYAFQLTSSEASVDTGEFVGLDLDVLVDDNAIFPDPVSGVSLVGSPVRILAGDSLATAALDTYTITEFISTTSVRLDRPVSAASDGVEYVVGEILTISSMTDSFPGDFEFDPQTSNSLIAVDGTIRFIESLVLAAPYIDYLRDRAERTSRAIQGDPVVDRLWARETIVDQDQLFKNFGFPIQVQQTNSQQYKNVLQGLWYAYWNGPSIENMVRGLNLVFNLPFAPTDGVITDISLPDSAFLDGTVTGPLFDVSVANSSSFLSFSVDGLPPALVIFPDDPARSAIDVRDDINAVVPGAASVTFDDRIRISGSSSVKIDTVIGNPGLGFVPGQEDFGTYNVTILGDDGESETFIFGSQFLVTAVVGQRVERFEPLTTAVGIFDDISLPNWWDIFAIAQINPSITTFSQEDRDIINQLHSHFTFAVRVLADAFTRLGEVDRNIVRFFLEQIKPTISDYLFIVVLQFFEIISVTDNSILLGQVPQPSQSYMDQRRVDSIKIDTLHLEIGLTTRRDIEWNTANHFIRNPEVHPTFGDRTTFETSYHLPSYDDFRLTTEDITLIAPGTVTLIDGIGVAPYKSALHDGSVAAQSFTTTGTLSIVVNGSPVVFPAFSSSTLGIQQVVEEANAFSVGAIGVPVMRFTPAMTLQLYADRFDAVVPTLDVLAAHAGFGFAISANLGQATSGSGILSTTSFS